MGHLEDEEVKEGVGNFQSKNISGGGGYRSEFRWERNEDRK
jgi:hypothetical protein